MSYIEKKKKDEKSCTKIKEKAAKDGNIFSELSSPGYPPGWVLIREGEWPMSGSKQVLVLALNLAPI